MRRLGLLVAFAVVVVDQVSKLWVADIQPLGTFRSVTGFFNLVHTLNPGISFSMFQNDGWGRWVFSALAAVVTAVLLVWLWRVRSVWVAGALGLIIGGAIGNTIDRLRIGAVIDFLDFHVAGFHWPAFNAADSAIVVGAAMILAEGILFKNRSS